jgi:hypothetical protein
MRGGVFNPVAFRFIMANGHPDHDTIATVRRRFLREIEGLIVRVLEMAREMGFLLKLGMAADKTRQVGWSPGRALGAISEGEGFRNHRNAVCAGVSALHRIRFRTQAFLGRVRRSPPNNLLHRFGERHGSPLTTGNVCLPCRQRRTGVPPRKHRLARTSSSPAQNRSSTRGCLVRA